MDEKIKQDRRIGQVHLALFAFFIIGGIVTKRAFGHPEFMMLWHTPGAVFLILGGRRLTRANRRQYYRRNFGLPNSKNG